MLFQKILLSDVPDDYDYIDDNDNSVGNNYIIMIIIITIKNNNNGDIDDKDKDNDGNNVIQRIFKYNRNVWDIQSIFYHVGVHP